jgi:molybdopterin/thiamine biosynthesis adenylyltransferase
MTNRRFIVVLDENRYSRNIALFSSKGQEKIAATKVIIVGLGGLGSHIAQQLAYLGVVDFALVDYDIVTASSLNRLIGAVEADVENQTLKVRVAERAIVEIQPTARFAIVDGKVTDERVPGLVLRADVVFGCLDRDLPRLQLTELCARHGKPYFDLASDTGGEGTSAWYGGRVVFCDGTRCLSSLDLLDQKQMARDSMSPEQRAADDEIYGIHRATLDQTGPAVVSINGVVASIAVSEFMVLVTGIREPITHLRYRGDLAQLTKSLDPPRTGCWYCNELWGRGEAEVGHLYVAGVRPEGEK